MIATAVSAPAASRPHANRGRSTMTIDHSARPKVPAALRAAALEAAQRLAGFILVDGALSGTVSGRQFDVRDPATGERVCGAADAEADDVEIAVGAARAAHSAWTSLPARERGKRLIEGARILAAHAEELA